MQVRNNSLVLCFSSEMQPSVPSGGCTAEDVRLTGIKAIYIMSHYYVHSRI
jgi:hypothetical protein